MKTQATVPAATVRSVSVVLPDLGPVTITEEEIVALARRKAEGRDMDPISQEEYEQVQEAVREAMGPRRELAKREDLQLPVGGFGGVSIDLPKGVYHIRVIVERMDNGYHVVAHGFSRGEVHWCLGHILIKPSSLFDDTSSPTRSS
jgi:hypothetical protein